MIDEKSRKNIFIHNISHKTLICPKPLCVTFYKVDEFNRVYDGTRYLLVFGPEKKDVFYNRIRYLIGLKSCVTYVISRNYARIKVDSYDSVPLEKILTLHNVIIHIKSLISQKIMTNTFLIV